MHLKRISREPVKTEKMGEGDPEDCHVEPRPSPGPTVRFEHTANELNHDRVG